MWNKKQKNPEFMHKEYKLVVDRRKGRGGAWAKGQMGEGGQNVQTFSYKINKP